MTWSPQNIADLRRHWADGKKATDIAKAMGITRNMVLAKANRLGLTRRTGTELDRFEALVDIVANAPLGKPIAVSDAAKLVGIPMLRAAEMWRALAVRYGEADIARNPALGDRLVMGLPK